MTNPIIISCSIFLLQLLTGFSGTKTLNTETANTAQYTYTKVYLVTDEDYDQLIKDVGVPNTYDQLSLCENNSATIIGQIEEGTTAAFKNGKLLPWCYTVPGGNPHAHMFIKVPKSCNQNVALEIQLYSNQIIAKCPFKVQERNPPHTIGKSSWSIIFQNQMKNQ